MAQSLAAAFVDANIEADKAEQVIQKDIVKEKVEEVTSIAKLDSNVNSDAKIRRRKETIRKDKERRSKQITRKETLRVMEAYYKGQGYDWKEDRHYYLKIGLRPLIRVAVSMAHQSIMTGDWNASMNAAKFIAKYNANK
jgi:hypothetical protein